jgi:hypothetical protein
MAILNASMTPTVFDCGGLNSSPGFFCHQHRLEKVDLVYVPFACIIKVECTSTESSSIVCLEAADDPCIQGLYEGSQIRLKVYKLDVMGLI